MEPPKGPINIKGWLAPLNWMISSRNLRFCVICNKCIITPFMAWKGLFQHLEGSPMDDFHEFRRAMKLRLKNGGYIGLPIMFLSLGELWPQVV
jgi:hypothetical protein